MDDEYYDADDTQESSLFCPLYPIISYPCCKASFADFVMTPPLFFGMLLPCCFLGNEWGNRRSAAKFQKEGESIKGVVADSRNWITTQHKFRKIGTYTVQLLNWLSSIRQRAPPSNPPTAPTLWGRNFLFLPWTTELSTAMVRRSKYSVCRLPRVTTPGRRSSSVASSTALLLAGYLCSVLVVFVGTSLVLS